jgi:phosphopantetheinyl transferase (holo-ACP synthase)
MPKSGMTSAEDDKCSEHKSTSKTHKNMYQLKECILKNRSVTIQQVTNMSGISFLPGSELSQRQCKFDATKFAPCIC